MVGLELAFVSLGPFLGLLGVLGCGGLGGDPGGDVGAPFQLAGGGRAFLGAVEGHHEAFASGLLEAVVGVVEAALVFKFGGFLGGHLAGVGSEAVRGFDFEFGVFVAGVLFFESFEELLAFALFDVVGVLAVVKVLVVVVGRGFVVLLVLFSGFELFFELLLVVHVGVSLLLRLLVLGLLLARTLRTALSFVKLGGLLAQLFEDGRRLADLLLVVTGGVADLDGRGVLRLEVGQGSEEGRGGLVQQGGRAHVAALLVKGFLGAGFALLVVVLVDDRAFQRLCHVLLLLDWTARGLLIVFLILKLDLLVLLVFFVLVRLSFLSLLFVLV